MSDDRVGAMRFGKDELTYLPLMRKIYEFEASRVSGPGSARRDIRAVLWTLDEFFDAGGVSEEERGEARRLVELLLKKGQLLEVAAPSATRYVTRTAETVRLLGHGYSYWRTGRPAIEAVRWIVDDKKIPRRELSAEATTEEILAALARRGIATVRPNMPHAVGVAVQAVARAIMKQGDWRKAMFSRFQVQAAAEILLSNHGGSRPHQMLLADVGSGKTYAFLIGIVAQAIDRIMHGEDSLQLLLYPRTALAKNQFNNLQNVVSKLPESGGPRVGIHLEHASYYKGESVAQGVRTRYGKDSPPQIVVTTLETLKRRLHRREFANVVSKRLERVVLDEVHLVEGTTGTNVVRLLERVKATAERPVRWTGVSATVATPAVHGGVVFGVRPSDIQVVLPQPSDMEHAGIVHHVFLKPRGDVSSLGSLVNATSVLIHSRRHDLGNRPPRNKAQKAVAFADNLDALGRWNADFKENERTENTSDRPHPTSGDNATWPGKGRDVPYALRFVDPFTRRIRASDADATAFPRVLGDRRVQDPCRACREGRREVVGECSPAELRDVGRLVLREPVVGGDPPEPFVIENPAFVSTVRREVGTLDLCPFLQSGTCARFCSDGFQTEPIPGTPHHEWRHVARSKLHHSKSGVKDGEDVASDDLQEMVFTGEVREVYGVPGREQLQVDVVFASPSLEVGVDLENVTEEMMYKAIRNIASYRQKAGRAGREEGTDTMIVTLLTQRAIDFHYYRQPRKLIRTGLLDAVPLKRRNRPLMVAALYAGVWDILTKQGPFDDNIQPQGFRRMLEECLAHLTDHRSSVTTALARQVGSEVEPADIALVIDEAVGDVSLLLTPTKGLFEGPSFETVADLVADFVSRGRGPTVRREVLELEKNVGYGTRDLSEAEPQVEKLVTVAAAEARQVRQMAEAGWDAGRLSSTIESLRSKFGDSFAEVKYLRALEDVQRCLRRLDQLVPGASLVPLVYLRQMEEAFKDSRGRAHYLSYHLGDLPIFKARRNPVQNSLVTAAFVLPTLFTNPYEPRVDLVQRQSSGSPSFLGSVSVAEALYTAVPGTWTYRLGASAMKALTGPLRQAPGGTMIASLGQLRQLHDLVQIRDRVKGPPWVDQPLSIWRPTRLSLQWTPKYVLLEPTTGMVADRDEAQPLPQQDHGRIKVPTSFAERWLEVREERAERILCHPMDFDLLRIEEGGKTIAGEEARARIRHPLMAGLLADARWHEQLRVVEFVHGVGRAYTSREVTGASLVFEEDGHPVGFGHEFSTEGASLVLDPASVHRTIEMVTRGIMSEGRTWAASAISAFGAICRTLARSDATRISSYTLRDYLRLLVADDLERPVTILDLADRARSLARDEGQLREKASRFVARKYRSASDAAVDDGGSIPHAVADARTAQRISEETELLVGAGTSLPPKMNDLDRGAWEWATFTLLNTLGVVAAQSLQRLSGVPEDRIGYFPDMASAATDEFKVYLYDRDQHGNGACRLLRDYMHILYIQRLSPSEDGHRMLPSEDFLTILEQQLLQCPQFHVDTNALRMSEQETSNLPPSGFPEFTEYHAHSREVKSVGSSVWRRLGIRGPVDAWKLPVLHFVHDEVAERHGLERDDVYRATGACWNGCPECVQTDSGLLGPVTGRDYLDKLVMDTWFREGIASNGSYEDILPNELANGTRPKRVGARTALYLEGGERRYRAISLPFTVGLSLDRRQPNPPTVILRSGDFEGHIVGDVEPGHGAGPFSVGMARLLWYQLLTSSYLAAIGTIPAAERQATMVFFEMRDIPMDESGFSEKMRASLEAIKAGMGHGRPITRLSEMVEWMTLQGYEFRVCVDANRAKVPEVAELLARLRALPGHRINVTEKALERASMHAKGMLTPLGGIYGSANLTASGTRTNDEMVRFVRRGTAEYGELKSAMDDILASPGGR